MTIFVGIDPGLTGAWAAINERGFFICVTDIPVMANGKGSKVQRLVNPAALAIELASLRATGEDVIVALEKTSAMPGQGSASMYSMGDTYGAIRAVVALKGFRCEHVAAATWKRAMGLDSDKERCRARAIAMFPNAAGLLARKKDHNRAEALLLANWVRRLLA